MVGMSVVVMQHDGGGGPVVMVEAGTPLSVYGVLTGCKLGAGSSECTYNHPPLFRATHSLHIFPMREKVSRRPTISLSSCNRL